MIPDDRQSKDENDEEVEEIIRDDTNRPQPNQSPDINQDRNILYQISQDEVRLICKFVNNVRISFTECSHIFEKSSAFQEIRQIDWFQNKTHRI